jgi:hypothetical protein
MGNNLYRMYSNFGIINIANSGYVTVTTPCAIILDPIRGQDAQAYALQAE